MSDVLRIDAATTPTADILGAGFTVKSLGGCRFVFGAVPLSDIPMLSHGYSERAAMDMHLADLTGALMVVGEPEALQALRARPLPISEKRVQESEAAGRLGFPVLAAWLRTGERGAAANALCKRLYGLPTEAGIDHPHDPADLRRCLVLLEVVRSQSPEMAHPVQQMSDVSQAWAALVTIWDDLAATFAREVRLGVGRAPQTYDMMKAALGTMA